MELLSQDEIQLIVKTCGYSTVLNWTFEDLTDQCIGYLGDHLKLIIEVTQNGTTSKLYLFVKCMPRSDKWKNAYLEELGFFRKEYVMLSELFKTFEFYSGPPEWRPKSVYIKEDIFVFEDVSRLGYRMPNHIKMHQDTMTFEEIKACVETLAIFHAESFNYEETRHTDGSKSIWDLYSSYLQEPSSGQNWRDTGRNAVIEFLKVFSKYKSKCNFTNCVNSILPKLFDTAMDLMQPSKTFYNVVVHRDLWTNNIFIKNENQNSTSHALFVDYQTVLYSSPMLDLSSLICFNTTRRDRDQWTTVLLDIYYITLSERAHCDIGEMFDITSLRDEYKKCMVFGLTQAALITPIVAMSKEKRKQIFCNLETSTRINEITRSQEFIDVANEDKKYQTRVTELFDEIVERYVFPDDFEIAF